jgi:hypothetical protein
MAGLARFRAICGGAAYGRADAVSAGIGSSCAPHIRTDGM